MWARASPGASIASATAAASIAATRAGPGSCARRCWRARDPGRLGETRGQCRVMAPALRRQEVRLHRAGDELVAELDRRLGWQRGRGARRQPIPGRDRPHRSGSRRAGPAGLLGQVDEPVLEALDQPDDKVRLEDPAAPPRRGAGSGGRSIGRPLEGRRRRGELVEPERLPGRCQEPQDPPAFGCPLGEACHHELFERAGQRRAGELAPGGEELLGHERIATRPFRDEQQDRCRRALALDPLDELGELVTVERRQGQLGRRLGPVGHRREGGLERMAAGQLVGAVRPEDAQPRPVGRPGRGTSPAPGSRRQRTGGPRAPARPAPAPRSG